MSKRMFLIFFLFACLFVCIASGQSKPLSETSQDEKPQRIVSTLPSLTEICFALGLGDSLVGVSDFCNYPPATKKITRIGGAINPNFEQVIALAPDLILLQQSDKNLIGKYKQLGLRVLALQTRTVKDILDSIATIGVTTGRERQAQKLKEKIQAALNAVTANSTGRKPVKTLLVIGHEPGSLRELYIAGPGTFHDELLTMAGGANCMQASAIPYPKISKEEILKQSPEAILILSADAQMNADAVRDEMNLWDELGYIEAVKNDAVYLLKGSHLFIPGPRMSLIAEDFERLLSQKNKQGQ